MSLLPSASQWKGWSLPSKLTAVGTLIGALSLALYLLSLGSGLFHRSSADEPRSPSLPAVALELSNRGSEAISILPRGDLVLWLPTGVQGGVRSLSGKYELVLATEGQPGLSPIQVGPGSSVRAAARVLDARNLEPVLEAGSTDLELILKTEDGTVHFSGSIPFTEHAIRTTRFRIELGGDGA